MGDSSPGEKAVTRPAVLPPLTSAALAGRYNTVTLCMYVHTSNTLLPHYVAVASNVHSSIFASCQGNIVNPSSLKFPLPPLPPSLPAPRVQSEEVTSSESQEDQGLSLGLPLTQDTLPREILLPHLTS